MKPRWIRTRLALLCAALLLCAACARGGEERPLPAEEPPAATLPLLPETEWAVPELSALALPPESDGRESIPQTGEPVFPQPGDTTDTWNPAREGDYPPDARCSPRELLDKWMAVEGLTLADLEARDCRQLVLAVCGAGDSRRGLVFCWELDDRGEWALAEELSALPAWFGARGITHGRRQGTYTSPAGLWGLTLAFGSGEAIPGSRMPWRAVTEDSFWICDNDSLYYNTWQERGDPALLDTWDEDDGEHLMDFGDSYRYAVATDFNTPPYARRRVGAAIFLHCDVKPTAGCVGVGEEDMVSILRWLDPEQGPCILITGRQAGA